MILKKKKMNLDYSIPRYKTFITYFISVITLIFPFITFLKIDPLSGNALDIFPNSEGLSLDFFLYYKSWFLIIACIFILCFFIAENIFPDKKAKNTLFSYKENKILIYCIGIYVIMVVLSAVFSTNRESVLLGCPNEYEGALLLAGYGILFLAGLNYFNVEKHLRIFLYFIFVLMSVISVLSFIEFLYKPIFEIGIFNALIAPSKYRTVTEGMKNTSFRGMIALTFYNPNYLGGFCALLFPVSVVLIKIVKQRLMKIVASLVCVLFLFTLIFSRSSAGAYSTVFSVLLLILIYRRELFKSIKYISVLAGVFIIIAVIVYTASGGVLLNTFTRAFFRKGIASAVPSQKFILRDIELNKNELIFTGDSDILIMTAPLKETADARDIIFSDGDNQNVSIIIEAGVIKITDIRYDGVTCGFNSKGDMIGFDFGYKDLLHFFITPDGVRGVGQSLSKIDSVSYPRNEFFTRFYGIATGRGYSWFNTLPLLKDTIFIGRGPGNFAYYFPQNDYVGLLNTHGTALHMVDKPHNTYLQIGVNTGLISLAAVLVIFALSLYKGMRMHIIRKKENGFISDASAAIFTGTASFMMVCMINDSIVCVNPLFWLMLGINFCLYNLVNDI